jgi:ubiquinone/menaquinone biosynthesis C-methylase UbiE
MKIEGKPHSEDVLGDWRDQWWAPDYLELVARRLGLDAVERALDVGSGHGHWASLLLPQLAPNATVIGVDMEPSSVDAAKERAGRLGLSTLDFRTARADALPYDDARFDLVTCQTLLMHVADPRQVLTEMRRVLRPGGLLLASEPSNLANHLLRDSITATYAPDRIARMTEFYAYVAEGRRRRKEGDECIADILPPLLRRIGFTDLGVYQNDCIAPIHPPYTQQMHESLGPMPELVRKREWLFDPAYAFRLFEAGGGTHERFELLHAELLDYADSFLRDWQAGTYWCTSGHNHQLVWARK